MKISLAQHGGHMAAFNRARPPQTIDSAALDQPKAAELEGSCRGGGFCASEGRKLRQGAG